MCDECDGVVCDGVVLVCCLHRDLPASSQFLTTSASRCMVSQREQTASCWRLALLILKFYCMYIIYI